MISRVRDVAKTITKRAPLAIRAAKRALVEGLAANPNAAAAIERLSYAHLFNTRDVSEGIDAFLEKRDPDFKGE